MPDVPDGVEAVAVCLLHADLSPAHEQAVAAVLTERGLDVTCSSEVSPEFREYERTVTTVLNAYLRPAAGPTSRDLSGLADEVLVMTSAGGLVPADEAADLPVSLLLLGPGGRRGGRRRAAAAAAGFPDAVTFDMGGTSTDVCLVQGGMPEPAARPGGRRLPGAAAGPRHPHHRRRRRARSPPSTPVGRWSWGPAVAGRRPRARLLRTGWHRPTVTDADLVLERIPADAAVPGPGHASTPTPPGPPCPTPASPPTGVVAVVDAAMERAVRAVTVERGVDPGGLALVAFGGAGPLHACAIADALGMRAVVVPPRAGVLSAVGLLCSPRQRDLVRSWPTPGDHTGLDDALAALADEAAGTRRR